MQAAVLVIDVQVGLVTGAYQEKLVLDNINRVVAKVRDIGGAVVFVQHCHASYEPMKRGQPGWSLHPQLDVAVSDILIEKTASDAFYETELEDRLQALGVRELYIAGLQTEYCVDATCRSAQSKGYAVTLVEDAHTTGDSHLSAKAIIEHHNVVLGNLAHPDFPIQVRSSRLL